MGKSFILAAALVVGACGDDSAATCVPGMSVECPCANGPGTQSCNTDGTFGECTCFERDGGAAVDVTSVDASEPRDSSVDASVVDGGGADMSTAEDAGAADSGPLEGECADGTCVFVARRFDIPESVGGRAYGENLDSEETREDDPTGCGIADYESLIHGTPGVDNAFAGLTATFNGLGAGTIAQVYSNAIASGEMLLMIKLEGVDGRDDPEIQVSVWYGRIDGSVELDDDLLLAAGQTIMAAAPASTGPGVISGGRFWAAVPTLPLFLQLDSEAELGELTLSNSRISARIDGSTLMDGEMAGAVSTEALVDLIAPVVDIDPSDAEMIFRAFADIRPDVGGVCQDLSVGAFFEGVAAVEGL